MNRTLLAILIVLIFLITSIGVISAADDSNSIDVKVIWEGDLSNQPDQVTVNLIKDGKIVDTAKLNNSNSWKATFNVTDDGDYQVKEVNSDDFSAKVSGNAKKGFVITNTIAKQDVLGAADDETPLEDSQSENAVSGSENNALAAGGQQIISAEGNGSNLSNTNDTNNTANATNNNATDNSTDTNATGDVKDNKKTTTTTKTKTTTKIIKPDKDKKKPVNKTKTKKNNTGLPIVVLVLAVFVAAFVPFSRKK